MRRTVAPPSVPAAIGPYSPALRAGSLIFVSGQIPLDPATGQLVGGDVRAQAARVLDTIGELLRAAGADYSHVVRTTIFLVDLDDFAVVNEVYAAYFREPYPARATVEVARLPRDARIEIDAVAVVDDAVL